MTRDTFVSFDPIENLKLKVVLRKRGAGSADSVFLNYEAIQANDAEYDNLVSEYLAVEGSEIVNEFHFQDKLFSHQFVSD